MFLEILLGRNPDEIRVVLKKHSADVGFDTEAWRFNMPHGETSS